MSKFIDLSEQKFCKLTVLEFDGRRKNQSFWKCLCDCGKTSIVNGGKLKNGHTKSCGCLLNETRGQSSKKHGMSHTPEHNVWLGMQARCYNENNDQYKDWGGRGITVCDRWLGDEGFVNFFADMGKRPSEKHTIERGNNDGNYSPDNCSWELKEVQANNTRSNVFITYNGQTKTVANWGKKIGIPGKVLRKRIKRGWGIEAVLTTPLLKNQFILSNGQKRNVSISNFMPYSFGYLN